MDTAVALVKAYLELSGYFVLAELPVRERRGHSYQDVTDLDVVAVRFPHAPPAGPAARPLEVFLGIDPGLGTYTGGVDVIVGEVKEGQARLNRALRLPDTIAFALRRLACCPEPDVERVAAAIAREGARDMAMPGHTPCRVRLVAFGGAGRASERGVLTVPLAHCAEFISARLRAGADVLAGAQFKDPVLGLFALQAKIGAPDIPRPSQPARPLRLPPDARG